MRNSLRWAVTASSLMLGAAFYLLLTHTRWGVAFFQSPLGLLTLLFIAFIVPTLVFFALNRIQSALVGTKEQVTQLSQEIQERSILWERDQIARELHDSLAQVLGYVITQTQAIDQLLHEGEDKQILTRRERRVLRLVAQGLTNTEIAASLCISENTVKYHLKNILGKLHLRNRTQVVAWAAQHRYLQEDKQYEDVGGLNDRETGQLLKDEGGRMKDEKVQRPKSKVEKPKTSSVKRQTKND